MNEGGVSRSVMFVGDVSVETEQRMREQDEIRHQQAESGDKNSQFQWYGRRAPRSI